MLLTVLTSSGNSRSVGSILPFFRGVSAAVGGNRWRWYHKLPWGVRSDFHIGNQAWSQPPSGRDHGYDIVVDYMPGQQLTYLNVAWLYESNGQMCQCLIGRMMPTRIHSATEAQERGIRRVGICFLRSRISRAVKNFYQSIFYGPGEEVSQGTANGNVWSKSLPATALFLLFPNSSSFPTKAFLI